MGEIFEKLLLTNEILSSEELNYYRHIQSSQQADKHLGDILLERGLISKDILEQLLQAEKETLYQKKILKKQRKDKKVLEIVQTLGIVSKEEVADCIRARRIAESKGENIFLTDLFIKKGYLTPYLVTKFYKRGLQQISLPSGIKNQEELVVDIPSYSRDRFLGKIAIKNKILNKKQLEYCWKILKKHWPRKKLADIFLEQNVLEEKKIAVLLDVLKKALPDTYPYQKFQEKDRKLGQLLVKRNFLSPWRINKCLLKQLDILKREKRYMSLRQIIIEDGYLCNYQFEVVLNEEKELITSDLSDLVPPNEIKVLTKEDISKAIKSSDSDVHLVVEEEDIESFDFDDTVLKEDDSVEEVEEIFDAGMTEEEKIANFKEIFEEEKNNIEEEEGEEEILEALEADGEEEIINSNFAADLHLDINEVLEEVTLDASEECYAEELIMDDLQDMGKKKKKKDDDSS